MLLAPTSHDSVKRHKTVCCAEHASKQRGGEEGAKGEGWVCAQGSRTGLGARGMAALWAVLPSREAGAPQSASRSVLNAAAAEAHAANLENLPAELVAWAGRGASAGGYAHTACSGAGAPGRAGGWGASSRFDGWGASSGLGDWFASSRLGRGGGGS